MGHLPSPEELITGGDDFRQEITYTAAIKVTDVDDVICTMEMHQNVATQQNMTIIVTLDFL